MWVELAAIGAASLVIITLAIFLVRMLVRAARGGAASEERADSLRKSAEVQARADAILAEPLPADVPGAWDEYCGDGVPDSDRSESS